MIWRAPLAVWAQHYYNRVSDELSRAVRAYMKENAMSRAEFVADLPTHSPPQHQNILGAMEYRARLAEFARWILDEVGWVAPEDVSNPDIESMVDEWLELQ